jgi:DNA-binding transcriptional regulator YiaG
MKKKYASEALMVCHQSAESLLRLGIIDTDEMREFDEGCFVREFETSHETENPIEIEHTIPVTV